MSRSISIWFTEANGQEVDIDMGSNELLGGQHTSKNFWKLEVFEEIGVTRLRDLGVTDPVWFIGWEDINVLESEIILIETNKDKIPFHQEIKDRWISNLRICLNSLKEKAPRDSIPEFMIG